MRVIEDDLERMFVVDIGASRTLEKRGVESAQAVSNFIQVFTKTKRHCRGKHRILHIVHRFALDRRRDQMRPQQRNMRTVVVDRNHLAVDPLLQHQGATIGTDVFTHQSMGGIHSHITQMFSATVIGHFQTKPVIRIKHCSIVSHAHNSFFNPRQLLQGFNTTYPHMVSRDVDTGGNITLAVTEASSQDTAARSFQYSKVDGRIAQHNLRRLWPGHISLHRHPAIHLNTAGRGHADHMAAGLHDMCEHTCGGGFTIGAGNRSDRNTPRRTRGIEHIEYLTSDIARLALARRHVHAETRTGIDFDNGTANVFIGMRNIIGKKVHPANIETDRTHRANRHFAIVRMHYIG